MQINGAVNKPHVQIGAESRPTDGATARTDASHPIVPQSHLRSSVQADHVPAAELKGLHNQLGELESVRQQRVSAVKEKFAEGLYSTMESAEQTAANILNKLTGPTR